MRVLSVASEIHPLVKTGGLADVAGALPLALAGLGVEVTSLVPGYRSVMAALGRKKLRKVADFPDLLGSSAVLLSARLGELELLVLDAPDHFDREGGPYADASGSDHGDNWRRFAAFSLAAARVAAGEVKGLAPDLVHVHDWQAAMVPAYLRFAGGSRPPSVITIHNLAFQGQFPASVFPRLGLPDEAFSVDGVEYYGGVGFLKAGLQFADAITTVSPSYAREIRTPGSGMGLDGLLRARHYDLHGIVNGIDTGAWDPASDPAIEANFDAGSLSTRTANRRMVEERFGLDRDRSMLFAVISRLTWQKGMDVLAECVDDIVAAGARLAVLGSGDKAIEGSILAAASKHRGRASVVIGYDEGLSHLMQAGADAILVPSRFEPCGLTQLCALRYGCIPVVARTGGLADTVIDANHAAVRAGVATGLQFWPVTREALTEATDRAVSLFADRRTWPKMQKNGMKADVSWNASAQRYAALFRQLVARKAG